MNVKPTILVIAATILLASLTAFAEDVYEAWVARYNGLGSHWSQSPAACSLCGDVDGDGIINVVDVRRLANYLFSKQSLVCPEQADVDDYESITFRDVNWLGHYVLFLYDCDGWFLTCPPNNPPVQPAMLFTDTLKVNPVIVKPGESTAVVQVEYKNVEALLGFVLPLRFVVGSQIPVIDTIINGARFPDNSAVVRVDTTSGGVLFAFSQAPGGYEAGSDTMMTMYLSFEPAVDEQGVSIDTTGFFPNHHPLFLGQAATCLSPVLPVFCLAIPGDANASSDITLGDVIHLVNHIFDKDNPPCIGIDPGNCWTFEPICRGDVNSTESITLGDVIHLVNYIFDKDNPPCLGTDPGNCWTFESYGPCCLPVP
jgi:hypothetical protein